MRKLIWIVVGLMIGAGGLGGLHPVAAQTAPVRVALSGTAAPAGGNYSLFGFPVVTGTGQVAFQSNLPGGSSTGGVFVGAPGAVQAAALQGTPAPAGGTYGGLNVPVVNRSGQVAFIALLTGAGVTPSNDIGLYAGSVGRLVKVVREGDVVDVGGGVMRTVANDGIDFRDESGGQDGRGVSFTDTGFITYQLTFTDNSSGIFVSQIAPVPEPASMLVVGGAFMGLVAVVRRRRGATREPNQDAGLGTA